MTRSKLPNHPAREENQYLSVSQSSKPSYFVAQRRVIAKSYLGKALSPQQLHNAFQDAYQVPFPCDSPLSSFSDTLSRLTKPTAAILKIALPPSLHNDSELAASIYQFLAALFTPPSYMETVYTPSHIPAKYDITHGPIHQHISISQFYLEVLRRGGFSAVTNTDTWDEVADAVDWDYTDPWPDFPGFKKLYEQYFRLYEIYSGLVRQRFWGRYQVNWQDLEFDIDGECMNTPPRIIELLEILEVHKLDSARRLCYADVPSTFLNRQVPPRKIDNEDAETRERIINHKVSTESFGIEPYPKGDEWSHPVTKQQLQAIESLMNWNRRTGVGADRRASCSDLPYNIPGSVIDEVSTICGADERRPRGCTGTESIGDISLMEEFLRYKAIPAIEGELQDKYGMEPHDGENVGYEYIPEEEFTFDKWVKKVKIPSIPLLELFNAKMFFEGLAPNVAIFDEARDIHVEGDSSSNNSVRSKMQNQLTATRSKKSMMHKPPLAPISMNMLAKEEGYYTQHDFYSGSSASSSFQSQVDEGFESGQPFEETNEVEINQENAIFEWNPEIRRFQLEEPLDDDLFLQKPIKDPSSKRSTESSNKAITTGVADNAIATSVKFGIEDAHTKRISLPASPKPALNPGRSCKETGLSFPNNGASPSDTEETDIYDIFEPRTPETYYLGVGDVVEPTLALYQMEDENNSGRVKDIFTQVKDFFYKRTMRKFRGIGSGVAGNGGDEDDGFRLDGCRLIEEEHSSSVEEADVQEEGDTELEANDDSSKMDFILFYEDSDDGAQSEISLLKDSPGLSPDVDDLRTVVELEAGRSSSVYDDVYSPVGAAEVDLAYKLAGYYDSSEEDRKEEDDTDPLDTDIPQTPKRSNGRPSTPQSWVELSPDRESIRSYVPPRFRKEEPKTLTFPLTPPLPSPISLLSAEDGVRSDEVEEAAPPPSPPSDRPFPYPRTPRVEPPYVGDEHIGGFFPQPCSPLSPVDKENESVNWMAIPSTPKATRPEQGAALPVPTKWHPNFTKWWLVGLPFPKLEWKGKKPKIE